MEGPSGASSSGTGYKRSRGTNWTEEETEQLLEAWADREVQVLLDSGPHNRQAFERVSFNLAEHHMDKTPSQCREKIKKLKTMYRNLNNHGKVSKNIRGRLMHKLHQVMEGIPSVSSAISKCRSDDTTCNHEEMDGAETEGQTSNNVMGDDFVEKSFGIPIKMNILLSDEDFLDDDSSASSDPESVSSSDAEDVAPQRRVPKHRDRRKKTSRKRKESRSKRRSAVYVLIDKVISAQSAANERFSALEERRLLLDKELEEKRIEAEAARQEAQRQHELRLLSTMAQQMACILKDKLSKCHGRIARKSFVRFSKQDGTPQHGQVFTRVKTRMELNSCFNQDQNPAAFVRDWRSKKISPTNKSINQDTAPIVRRKTVITIGCPSELKGSIYQPEDHTVSASEVGETACGRISITVKTLPKTGIRKIPQGPIFNCDLHEEEEEWKDTVPFKSSSVSDPSWIYVPTKSVQPFSSNHQLTAWQEEQPSHDFGATLVSNSFKASNKKSCPTIDVDADQQFGNRKVNSDAVISKLDSPKVCAKPTFNVIMSGESKILHLAEQDAWSIEKDACRVEKSPVSSISRSPIGYRDWLKSLDRLEGESFPNQIHSTVDKKMKYQEVKQSTDPVTMVSNSSAIIQQVESLSAPRSILKNGQHECDYDIRQEKLDGVQNQQYQNKAVQAKIVHEDKPINMHNKTPLNWTDERSTSSLVGWTATFNNITDSKFNKMVPTKEVTHHAVPSKNEGFTANHQPTTTRDRANTMDVINRNQINTVRSRSSSGCWKQNFSTQDGTNEQALSSGMDLSKATELVRHFFNAEDVDNRQSYSLVVDKSKLSATKSILSSENEQTAHLIPHVLQGSVQDQRRGRTPIKSKIPLRIPRPASSSAFSNSNSSTLMTPAAVVEKGSNSNLRNNASKNKAVPSKIKPPSVGRTRSVDSSRLTSPLSNYVLYSNVTMARDEMMIQ
ncbi:uncharacterized protein LOC116933717 isoform X2 [Daphnia magna]|uniref:uncharacterized protein LOC116933717 isoform X2 n=1 Tax=Daphnia magna TaxID=35525 RepID=UPI001E1B9FD4|nr:uncharacterized protein LOC116933717 isoform X2 [Daphnia magna]